MARPAPFQLRPSPIAGTGAFATRLIQKGERIIEYTGERISDDEATRRYDDEEMSTHHTFLFSLEDDLNIDARVGGNDSRFINHSCAPNCEAIEEDGRIFIFATEAIPKGKELAYDYQYARGDGDELEEDRYPCHCGAPTCRGTILAPRKEPAKRAGAKKRGASSSHVGTKTKTGTKTKAGVKATGGAKRRRRAKAGATEVAAETHARQGAAAKTRAAATKPGTTSAAKTRNGAPTKPAKTRGAATRAGGAGSKRSDATRATSGPRRA